MSTETNVQVVKRLYDAMARGDMAGVFALLSEDVTFVVPGPPHFGPAGTWRGHEGVQQCFRNLREVQQTQTMEFREFVADRDKVVVLVHVTATMLATGASLELEIVHFFTIREGKIVSFRDFFDTAAVIEASRA